MHWVLGEEKNLAISMSCFLRKIIETEKRVHILDFVWQSIQLGFFVLHLVYQVIDRPGVAGAVLQTASSLISVIQ